MVLLFFKFEMDLIQFGVDYDKDQVGKGSDGFHENGWKFAWYALNGQTIKSYSMDNAGTDTIALDENFPGVKITIPANDFTAQRIFGPEEGRMVMDEIATYAYDPGNLDGREFQISGYASSGDAFRLATGLDSGSAYQLLTVGETNYLLYTVTREQVDAETGETTPATGIHASQLVLSKVKNTGKTVGLVNPVDENDKTPYLVVDLDAEGNPDATGDLDFTAQVNGDTIRVTWVSYAAGAGTNVQPGVPKPTVLRPSYTAENGALVYMSKLNYTDEGFKPVPPEGDRPVAPTAPIQADYWLSVADYAALLEADQAKYTAEYDPATGGETGSETGTVIGYYVADKGDSLTAAKSAFDAAQNAYTTEKAAYDAAMVDWNEYDTKLGYYDAWYDYFNADATAQDLLANSAKNTVVKTATFTVGTDQAFRNQEIVGTAGTYKFLPAMSADGSFVFYAQSKAYTTEEKKDADTKAKDYYNATKGDATTNPDSGLSTGDGDPTAAFRYAYATSMNDVYGKTTQFVFRYNNQTYLFEPTGWAEGNTRLSSVDLVMLDDNTFYLAYTATQTQTSVDAVTGKAGETNVHKLYLQKGSLGTNGVTLESAKLLRTLVDINEGGSAVTLGGNEAKQDGVYVNGTLKEAHEDPYFGKVRFLHGKLGGLTGESEDFTEELPFTPYSTEDAKTETSETFLLFEMNGAAYVVPQTSLASITGDSGTTSGSIIPFFTVTDETRGRGNLDIGADGEGNISVVYTAAVPNTTNNAIYVAKYDAETGSFGQGRMLAMNQMQVYEDSIANGWSSEDTEKAYLGQLESYDYAPDPLTSFTFSDLAVAVGLKKGTTVTTVVKDENGNPVIGEDGTPETQSKKLESGTLVILARGTQTTLEEQPFLGNTSEETTVIAPAYDANGLMMTNTGMYALSFGVGEKSVGEGRILFESDDFVPGAQLRPTVTFKNTGDVPLHGSKADPITVKLWLSDKDGVGVGTELMTWTIQDNILVGQTVTTALGAEDFTSPLPDDLNGRCFYFTVSETKKDDGAHIGGVDDPLVYDSHAQKKDEQGNPIGYVGYVRTIEAKPELAVEDLQFSTLPPKIAHEIKWGI